MVWGVVKLGIVAVMLGAAVMPVLAETTKSGDVMTENFTMQPETRWRFFTDQVMGGVSTGGVAFAGQVGETFARMTGRVSTANQGGFIQMRLDLTSRPPEGTTGVRLIVRGNDQRYFVHLRTTAAMMPWQYYQAGFDVTDTWAELRLPFDAFTASGGLGRAGPRPGNLTSVAIVAFGRDHDALIEVREVGFY